MVWNFIYIFIRFICFFPEHRTPLHSWMQDKTAGERGPGLVRGNDDPYHRTQIQTITQLQYKRPRLTGFAFRSPKRRRSRSGSRSRRSRHRRSRSRSRERRRHSPRSRSQDRRERERGRERRHQGLPPIKPDTLSGESHHQGAEAPTLCGAIWTWSVEFIDLFYM